MLQLYTKNMKTLLKTNKDLEKHNETMEGKLSNNPFVYSGGKPIEFPCIVISNILRGVNGFQINNEFVYKKDFGHKNKKHE